MGYGDCVVNQNVISLPANEILRLMHSRQISPLEVVQAHLDRIDQVNSFINAVVTIRATEALAGAREAERLILSGVFPKLTGLPVTIKDNIETAGIRTTAGTRLLENNIPLDDAPVVGLVKGAGAIVLGKTNTPELAMSFATDNAVFGRTRNPWRLQVTPGGSSGGEAAIVAARGSPLGIGTDLGGSLRVPAHFCGLAGFRPSVGLVPSGGHIPELRSPLGPMSVSGPLARSVADLDLAMAVIAGAWPSHTWDGGARVAFYDEDGVTPTTSDTKSAVRSATESAKAAGCQTEERIPPGLADLYRVWSDLWLAWGGARHLLEGYLVDEYDGRRISESSEILSSGLRKFLQISPASPDPASQEQAVSRLDELSRTMAEFFTHHDLVICPVAAGPATVVPGRWNIDGSDIRGDAGFGYSYVWSVLGYPCLSLPWAVTADGLPIGVQVVGQSDTLVMSVGKLLEKQRGAFPAPPELAQQPHSESRRDAGY